MNEIIITQQGALKCDFEAMRNELNEKLDAYKNMIFTEDSKKEAKEVVAGLRKDKREFTEQVKKIKAEYMKPFEAFYEEACSVIDLYDQPITFISEQIEAFESQRIEAKKIEIKAIYTEFVPEEDMIDLIPLQRIYNPKWENATFTAKAIKEEIMERKIKAKEAIETIKSMHSDKEAEAIEKYKREFDLPACILAITNYEAQKREIQAREEERIRRETEERIRAEERAKIESEQRQAEEIEKAKAEAVEALIPEENGSEVNEYSYTITMTPEAKEKLEIFMDSIGITYEELSF